MYNVCLYMHRDVKSSLFPPSLGGGGRGKQEEIFSSLPLLGRKSSEKGAFGQENQDLKNGSWEEYQVEKNYIYTPCICMM